jgi:phage gp29-like protein
MRITKARLKEIIKEEVDNFRNIQEAPPVENSADTNKKVLYSRAKQQIEEILNTLWDDLDAGGVPEAQAELNKLMAHLQKDMDSGFVGEPT